MSLIYKNEKTLFVWMLILSIPIWLLLIVGTVGLALVYALVFFIAYCFAQSGLISYLKGNAVQITAQQFPDLHAQIAACCQKLGLETEPDAYLLQMGGAFNAFATRFFGRDFLVLYSDVVDALADNPDALNFYIGHEIGHIKRRHLKWATVLMPASLLPLIGAAYSRAREYTCDRHGLAACDNAVNAQFGLAALAAGGKRWKTMSKTAYIGQARETDGFWMSFHELVGDYPWLTKRMGTVRALSANQEPDHPRRHPLAVVLALFVPRLGVGGAGGMLVTVAMIGVLAAVALPAYETYMQKAKLADAYMQGQAAANAVEQYYAANAAVPRSLDDVGIVARPNSNTVELITLNTGSGEIKVLTRIRSVHGQGALILSPSLDEQKHIVWRCQAQDLNEQALPAQCR